MGAGPTVGLTVRTFDFLIRYRDAFREVPCNPVPSLIFSRDRGKLRGEEVLIYFKIISRGFSLPSGGGGIGFDCS